MRTERRQRPRLALCASVCAWWGVGWPSRARASAPDHASSTSGDSPRASGVVVPVSVLVGRERCRRTSPASPPNPARHSPPTRQPGTSGFDPTRLTAALRTGLAGAQTTPPNFPPLVFDCWTVNGSADCSRRSPLAGRSDEKTKRVTVCRNVPDGQVGDQPQTEHSVAPVSWRPPQSGHCFLL